MSPPRSLRNMTSKLSLPGRRKAPRIADPAPSNDENRPLDDGGTTTPKSRDSLTRAKSMYTRATQPHDTSETGALQVITEENAKSESSSTTSQSSATITGGSISKRRGFRPLSIHTGKAFDPFGKCQDPMTSSHGTVRNSSCDIDDQTPKMEGWPSQADNINRPVTEDLNVTEADFVNLAASPGKCLFHRNKKQISPGLVPAPDITAHPAFQRDPFSAQSDSSLLKTASSPEQIRAWSSEARHNRVSTENGSSTGSKSSGSKSSGGSRKKLHFDKSLTASEDGANPLDLILGGSPRPKRAMPRSRASLTDILQPTPETTPLTDLPRSGQERGALPDVSTTSSEITPKTSSLKNALRNVQTASTSHLHTKQRALSDQTVIEPVTPTGYFSEDSLDPKSNRSLSNWFRQKHVDKAGTEKSGGEFASSIFSHY